MRRPILAAVAIMVAWPTLALALAQGDVPTGKYECWYFSTPLPGMALTIQGGGRYLDVQSKSGSYTFAAGKLAFKGGALDGQTAVYRPGNPPTIAFLGTGGRETEHCQPPH